MKIKLKIFWLLFFLLQVFFVQSQDLKWGMFVSAEINFGSHLKRYGLAANFFLTKDFYQFSCRAAYHFNALPIGAPIKGKEFQTNLAAMLGFYDDPTLPNLKYGTYFQSFLPKKYVFGYSYNFYFDQIGTSQRTGTILLQFNRIQIISENDILAQRAVDKFRTAAAKIVYLSPYGNFSVSTIMWTPDPKNVKRVTDSNYPSRFGYKDLTKQKYGKYSCGILAIGWENGFYSAYSGIESERIRHFFQNKLFHDMIFFPQKWNKARNPHYPMVSENGDAYLFKPGQKVRKAKYYWNIGTNASIFY